MQFKPLHINLILFFFALLLTFTTKAQVVFEIVNHKINPTKRSIDLELIGRDKGSKGSSIFSENVSDYSFTEIKTNNPDSVGDLSLIGNIDKSEFRLLFLIDKSGSMRNQGKFKQAKAAIKSSLKQYALPDSAASFAYFNEMISRPVIINLKNMDRVLNSVEVEPKNFGKDTHLYYTLNEMINYWKTRYKNERKIIFLLTDGEDDIIGDDKILNEPFNTKGVAKVTQADLITNVRKLDTLFLISCIGYGSDVDSVVLKRIVDATPNSNDTFLFAPNSDEIKEVMEDATRSQTYNLKLSLRPEDFCEYRGNPREMFIGFKYKEKMYYDTLDYS